MNEPQIRENDFDDEIDTFEQVDVETTSANDESSPDVKSFDKKQMFTLARRRVEERLELKRIFDDFDSFSIDQEF